jgi:uncharacterized protein
MFPRSRLNLRGQWVLVTGASAGLGAAIARELASRYRANLVLVARRKPMLEAFAADLESAFSVRVVAIEADLSRAEDVERAVAQIRRYAPVAAVLNAAITHNAYFGVGSLDKSREIIATNVAGMTAMLAQMVDLFVASQERRGILVISSIAGEISLPHQAAYAASKAYTTTLVQSVTHELAGTNVSLGVFLPGGIDTDMARSSDISSMSKRLGLMPPQRCARLAVNALVSGRGVFVPGLMNKVASVASRLLPRGLMSRFAAAPYRLPPR